MGLCYTLKLLATVLKWDLRGYWAKASWCQVSWRYATVRNLQVSYVHAGHLGVILPPSASQPLIAMKKSHTSSDQQADTSFPSYLSDRFIILKFFSYVAKEGRGKNRGNYNSGHRLHAKDFFGNNFAISQGEFNEGNLAEIFRQEGRNEGGLLSSIQLDGISFFSHLKGWKRK